MEIVNLRLPKEWGMQGFVKTNADIVAAQHRVDAIGWPRHKWNHFKNWEMLWLHGCVESGDILDVGCVTSMPLELAVALKNPGRRVGVDPVPHYGGWSIPAGSELYRGVAENLPVDSRSFDTVACMSVIEHGVDLYKFAGECARVLRPGGKLVVSFDYWPKKDPNALDETELEFFIKCLWDIGFDVKWPDGEVQDKIVDGLYTLGALRAVFV